MTPAGPPSLLTIAIAVFDNLRPHTFALHKGIYEHSQIYEDNNMSEQANTRGCAPSGTRHLFDTRTPVRVPRTQEVDLWEAGGVYGMQMSDGKYVQVPNPHGRPPTAEDCATAVRATGYGEDEVERSVAGWRRNMGGGAEESEAATTGEGNTEVAR